VASRTHPGKPPGPFLPAISAASRHLFGNPNPAAAVQVWPMQHPEQAVLLWSAALLLVFAPLAVHLYRRKSLS
jgi:ABC-2 type transport system permease protein